MPLSLVGRRASALIAPIGLATGIIASVTTCFAAALRAQDGGSALHRLTIAPMGGFSSYAPYYDRPISVDGNAVNFRLSVTDQAFVGAVARYDFPRSRWSLVASADRGKGKGRVDVCNKGNCDSGDGDLALWQFGLGIARELYRSPVSGGVLRAQVGGQLTHLNLEQFSADRSDVSTDSPGLNVGLTAEFPITRHVGLMVSLSDVYVHASTDPIALQLSNDVGSTVRFEAPWMNAVRFGSGITLRF